jgi:hypothetical protein
MIHPPAWLTSEAILHSHIPEVQAIATVIQPKCHALKLLFSSQAMTTTNLHYLHALIVAISYDHPPSQPVLPKFHAKHSSVPQTT